MLSLSYPVSKEEEICVGITTNPENGEKKIASKEVYKYLPPPLGSQQTECTTHSG